MPLPTSVQKLSEGFDLQPVVFLWSKLGHRYYGVALPVFVFSFLLQGDVKESLDIAGWVNNTGAVRGTPQCQNVTQSPSRVDHDHVTAGAGETVQQGEGAVIYHLNGAQNGVITDVVCIVEPIDKKKKKDMVDILYIITIIKTELNRR